ncbi:CoA transferase [Phyllobacterium sp. SB3]|uniref:CaiB/BaiF CoA transferase family protein n=1 Tax=Phyllobacterium sp. SB3 TaxID=3156073 RepID=UPI0032AF41B2
MPKEGALKGLRVLDLSRFIAGPFCGMQLGDLGADVVKVERKDKGEDTRPNEPQINGESLYILVHNRNKRGLSIDYRHPGAVDVLKRLIADSDVLIENFRPGTMEAMGLDWDTVHSINPRLIMVRISGFGQDGPWARQPCFDVIAQAGSGLMNMTGQSDGPPTMAGTFIVDYSTGLYATIATLAALEARHRTGKGQLVEASLLDSAVSFLMTAIPEYVLFGKETSRQGTRDRYATPANNFQCVDGVWVHISAGNDGLFSRFAHAAGLENMLSDPRFMPASVRMSNVDEVERIVAEWAANRSSADVLSILSDAEVPCAKIATIADVVSNPQLRHRKQIVEVDHEAAGKVPMQGPAIQLSETPTVVRRGAPSIGEHTDEILEEWGGYSRDDIARLREAKIV